MILVDLLPLRAVAARVGGEEFALFLPRVGLADARVMANGIRAELAVKRINGLPEGVAVTASLGVSEVTAGELLDAAMRRADNSLYVAKAGGRDRVECAEDPLPVIASGDHHAVGTLKQCAKT